MDGIVVESDCCEFDIPFVEGLIAWIGMEKTCLISNYHVKKRLSLIQTFTGTGGQTWYLIAVLSSPPDLTVIETFATI